MVSCLHIRLGLIGKRWIKTNRALSAGSGVYKAEMKHESYTERQARMGRPIAPHVTIYKFPPVALSSIVTRVTGVMLSAGSNNYFIDYGTVISSLSTYIGTIGVTGIGAMTLTGIDPCEVMNMIGNYGHYGSVAKFSVAFPFVFHYLSGVRHIIWNNNPDLLTNEKVERSSMLLFGTSLVVSAGIACITL